VKTRNRYHLHLLVSAAASVAALVLVSVSMPICAHAAGLNPGDIVIGQLAGTSANPDAMLLRVDPVTGDRTIISDNSVGTGPSFNPSGAMAAIDYLSWQSDGSILATESGLTPGTGTAFGEIFRVDPATGDRTLITTLPTSAPTDSAYFAARQFGNRILATAPGELLSIDPTTGISTIVSGSSVGTGPSLTHPFGFVVSGTNVIVADTALGIVNIDTLTGNRTILSGLGVGAGPTLTSPADVAFDPLGNLLATTTDLSTHALLRIDPITGDRTIVSSQSVGTGPTSAISIHLSLNQSGSIFTTTFPSAVFQIDPLTGNRTLLASATQGTGPWGSNLDTSNNGILVVPNVPEPSTLVLAALGGLALLAWRMRCSVPSRV
jgi:hypothetical protein